MVKFWEFYQSSIKLKPNPNVSSYRYIFNKKEIKNDFNKHFSSFKSEIKIPNTERINLYFLTFFKNTIFKILQHELQIEVR